MSTKRLEYGFLRRTILYGAAGICGITIDTAAFMAIEASVQALPLAALNVFTYSLGTLVSYNINKNFSFRSKTHRLSLRRFYLTSVFGMVLSTAILTALTQGNTGIGYAKITATIVAVMVQYAINTQLSLVSSQGK